MSRRPSAYGKRTSGPSTVSRASRRPRRSPPRFGPPGKTWRIWCGDSERLGKLQRIWSWGPPSAGRANPPLPPPSIPWPWHCWWPRCRSSPPGDFLPLPTASHIVATLGTIAAQRLTGAAGLSSLLVTQPAATVKGGSEARPQRTPDASPQALQPAPPRPLAPLPVPSHLNP
jgi:hypothetical protein